MKKFFGICVAMLGIIWYTVLKMQGLSNSDVPVYVKAANGKGSSSQREADQPEIVVVKPRDVHA
jgi:hypothetical protein